MCRRRATPRRRCCRTATKATELARGVACVEKRARLPPTARGCTRGFNGNSRTPLTWRSPRKAARAVPWACDWPRGLRRARQGGAVAPARRGDAWPWLPTSVPASSMPAIPVRSRHRRRDGRRAQLGGACGVLALSARPAGGRWPPGRLHFAPVAPRTLAVRTLTRCRAAPPRTAGRGGASRRRGSAVAHGGRACRCALKPPEPWRPSPAE